MQTSRLELVQLTEEHLPGYHAIWSDPFTTRWSPHGPCKTLKESKEWMTPLLRKTNPKALNYAVILRADLDPETIQARRRTVTLNDDHDTLSESVLHPGGFLGWVGTWRTDPVSEIGLIFHRSAWGFGFATEAVSAFLELFWRERVGLEFDCLDAWCDVENEASSRVLEKCGFSCVETVVGDYTLEWMQPSLRSSLHFRIRRPDTSSSY